MAEVAITYHGKSVRDVPAEDFIKAFGSYLKSTGKVNFEFFSTRSFPTCDCPEPPASSVAKEDLLRHRCCGFHQSGVWSCFFKNANIFMFLSFTCAHSRVAASFVLRS